MSIKAIFEYPGSMQLSKTKIAIFLFAIILVSAAAAFIQLHRPNLYQPGRGAIVEAVTLIHQTYAEEQSLQSKFKQVQKTLRGVVDYLDQAEKLDPEDKEKIEAVKRELMALDEYAINISKASSGHQARYEKIIENLNALLEKTEDGSQ